MRLVGEARFAACHRIEAKNKKAPSGRRHRRGLKVVFGSGPPRRVCNDDDDSKDDREDIAGEQGAVCVGGEIHEIRWRKLGARKRVKLRETSAAVAGG